MNKLNPIKFRCSHRHNGVSHPACYLRYLQQIKEYDESLLPKVLVFDIETSPLKAYVWQHSVWNANISEDKILSEWYMLTWAAKWLYSDNVMSDRLAGKEALAEDDSRIVKSLWKLLDEADIVIAHNSVNFDVPNMNTRFIVNGLPPTTPYRILDTLKIARKQFGFTHNNLNALARVFGFDAKLETNFDLWKRCVDGDDSAFKEMETYNIQDVKLLEDVYLKLRPWIKSHPNLGLYIQSENPVCPACGSDNIHIVENKFDYTNVSKFPLFRCDKCGAYARGRKNIIDKLVRDNLVRSVTR